MFKLILSSLTPARIYHVSNVCCSSGQPFHASPGNVFWCQDVLKFLRQVKLRRDAQQKNEIKWNFHLETPVMHLGSINRFKRPAGINPKMHTFFSLFQIVGRKTKLSQLIYWFVVRWCCWTTKSLTYSYLGSKRKAVSNKTLDKLISLYQLSWKCKLATVMSIKLTFRALALRQSKWRHCGLCVGLYGESGATLLVET